MPTFYVGSACSPASTLLPGPSLLLPFFLSLQKLSPSVSPFTFYHPQSEDSRGGLGMVASQTAKDIGKLSSVTSQGPPVPFPATQLSPLCALTCSTPQSPGFYSYLFRESETFSFMLDEFQDSPKFSHVCCGDAPTSPSVNICIFLFLYNNFPHTQHPKTTQASTVSGSL